MSVITKLEDGTEVDDTYVVKIPSILKLKKLLGESPLPPVDPKFKIKSRWYKK